MCSDIKLRIILKAYVTYVLKKTLTFNLQHCHFERNKVELKNLKTTAS